MAKTTCKLTRNQFTSKATKLKVDLGIAGTPAFTLDPKEFATLSLGWGLQTRLPITVDGVACEVIVGLNMTLVGSKELPGAA